MEPMVRGLAMAVVLGMSPLVAAQDASNPESTRLFEEGRTLANDGKYAEACDAFARSLELDPAPGTKLGLAECHEHLGHLAQAYRLFVEVADGDKATNLDREKVARGRADVLAGKLGTVALTLASAELPGLTVSIAGRVEQPAAEIREVVEPGRITVEVTAPGYRPVTRTVEAQAGVTARLDVPAMVPVAYATPASHGVRRRTRVLAAYTLGGIGLTGLTAGIALGIVANNRYNAELDAGNCERLPGGGPPQCNPEGYRRMGNATTLGNVGTGFAVGGLALVTAGTIVFFTAPRDVVITPTGSAHSAGLAVVGRF